MGNITIEERVGYKAVIDHTLKTYSIFATLDLSKAKYFPGDLAKAIENYCNTKAAQGYRRI